MDGLRVRAGGQNRVSHRMTKTVYVLNGPNLNLLGTREPQVYGSQTLADVEQLCTEACARHGFTLVFRQSNHEGALVDWIHEAGRLHAAGQLAGLVLNAAAYTHTSVALLDAVRARACRWWSCTSATCMRARRFVTTPTCLAWPGP